MLEFEQIVKRILKKKRVVFDTRAWKPHTRLLKKFQAFPRRPIGQFLPLLFREKHQPEMTRIDSLLLRT